ncbi:MAG TPA: hypothetical protein VG757_01690 [Devosia sp.]|nr:hypothetical protein [Devosia sp.]
MSDRYAAHTASLTAPASNGFDITPDDDEDLPEVVRAIYVGGAGDVAAVLREGATLTFANLPAGSLLPVRASRIKATGTTASGLIGLV